MQRQNDLSVIEIFGCDLKTKQRLPLYSSKIHAGFPSPADDYQDKKLDLNEFLIKHPTATFFVKVKGESMINAGIHSGDILIVDRSIEPKNNQIVVAVVDGDFTVKRVQKKAGKLFLVSENPEFSAIEVSQSCDFEIWGAVLHVIHSF